MCVCKRGETNGGKRVVGVKRWRERRMKGVCVCRWEGWEKEGGREEIRE